MEAHRSAAQSAPDSVRAIDSTLVRAELQRILRHPLFGHSKLYPAFLRYVVERTLEGRQDELKERTVGIEALGRPATYDTAQDPVVRATAAEVRKRLAQYYQEAGGSPVRIDVPVGSYVPRFESMTHTAAADDDAPAASLVAPAAVPYIARRSWLRWGTLGVTAAAGVVVAVFLLTAAEPPSRTALDRFWEPLLAAPGTVTVSVGNARGGAGLVAIESATTMTRIAGLLQERDKPYAIKNSNSVDFASLRADPIVTIGAYSNRWTLKINEPLRFHFSPDAADGRILDRQHPQAPGWPRGDRDGTRQVSGQAFALVSRVRDQLSGQHALTLGGLGVLGTLTAAEFVTTPAHLEAFAGNAPSGWETKNIQIVIGATVTDGVAGPPRVVAAHFWN